MGRTPSLTAQARCPDFYEWGKNGERESGSERDEGKREAGFLVTRAMPGLICMSYRLMRLRFQPFGVWNVGLFGYVLR